MWTDSGADFTANQFGFYLDSSANGGGLFHSETGDNDGNVDHMFAYEGVGEDTLIPGNSAAGPWGSNEYILAWEDLNGGGDEDYTDFVVMIESITPVPEPGLAALLGIGLVGLGLSRRKNRPA